ncbi:cupin domain-containing protein [Leifsonia sp. NPDC077715]|uniref:cupin domain-containing protein n=1 Tax=Leifsonia sp. NPDC077715 TaxID=3155539 RepID=UPI0034372590
MSAPVRNVLAAFDRIPEPWQPHRLVSVNDQDVKVARLRGEFVWHSHPDSDELFLVVDGRLTLQLRDGDVELGPNDVYVVPAGVEHCPRADEEALVVMVERQGTVNTGDNPGERTTEVRELRED